MDADTNFLLFVISTFSPLIMPMVASTALAITLAEMELIPAISTTEAKSAISLSPIKEEALLAIRVETKTLGIPIGKFLMAKEEIVEPPLPPKANTPSH